MNISHITSNRRGFTIIELLVVIAIIAILMAILIPAIGYVKTMSKKAAAVALLNSIGTGLEQYYSDHNMYPPSDPTGAYPTVSPPLDRGGLMLTEGLTGFLDYAYDGAGPSRTPTPDPGYGFRTRTGGNGKIFGPYIQAEGPNWKAIPGATDGRHVMVDIWGDEILYFRAVPSMMNGNRRRVLQIFAPRGLSPDFRGIFFDSDNPSALKDDSSGGTVVTLPNPSTRTDFLQLLTGSHGASNTIGSGDLVTGRDTYLLVSAGPDREYFTKDDIVQAGNK